MKGKFEGPDGTSKITVDLGPILRDMIRDGMGAASKSLREAACAYLQGGELKTSEIKLFIVIDPDIIEFMDNALDEEYRRQHPTSRN
jgi:hypothetical protein